MMSDSRTEQYIEDLEEENTTLTATNKEQASRVNELEWYIKDLLQAHGVRVIMDEYIERGTELLSRTATGRE